MLLFWYTFDRLEAINRLHSDAVRINGTYYKICINNTPVYYINTGIFVLFFNNFEMFFFFIIVILLVWNGPNVNEIDYKWTISNDNNRVFVLRMFEIAQAVWRRLFGYR